MRFLDEKSRSGYHSNLFFKKRKKGFSLLSLTQKKERNSNSKHKKNSYILNIGFTLNKIHKNVRKNKTQYNRRSNRSHSVR